MQPSWEGLALLVGAFLGAGGVTALLRARSQNRQANATAEVTLGDGWHELWVSARIDAQVARDEVSQLRERVAVLEKSEERCRIRLAQLENRLSPERQEQKIADLLDTAIARREEPT